MRLFHGSTCVVIHPAVRKSRPNLDFGPGFYLTSFSEQAEDWARRKAFLEGASAYVNCYDVRDELQECKDLRFPEPNEDWVEFVCACRRGEDAWKDYDVVIGGVADDRVYYAVDMYYQGVWSIEQTIKALRFYKVSRSRIEKRLCNLANRFSIPAAPQNPSWRRAMTNRKTVIVRGGRAARRYPHPAAGFRMPVRDVKTEDDTSLGNEDR